MVLSSTVQSLVSMRKVQMALIDFLIEKCGKKNVVWYEKRKEGDVVVEIYAFIPPNNEIVLMKDGQPVLREGILQMR